MVFRWLNPALFIGAALYVRSYNGSHTDSQIVFPLIGPLVGPDPMAQREFTWELCLGIGAVLAVVAVVQTVRERGGETEE